MDWQDLQGYSPLEDSLYGLLPSPPQEAAADDHDHQQVPAPAATEWTYQENKLFEAALAEFDISSPDFFEHVAQRVPGKSVEDIKKHYQALVDDVELIESGRFPLPDYQDDYDDYDHVIQEDATVEEGNKGKHQAGGSSAPSEHEAKPRGNGPPRRRGVPWSEDEHQLFLMGLNKYGKGDWRSISRYYVITKTPTQVASHAQKYFRRLTSTTPAERRRPSIHDIQTVHPIPTAAMKASASALQAANNTAGLMTANLVLDPFANPHFAAPSGQIPMLNPSLHGGAAIGDQNPMFMSSASSSSPPVPSAAAAFMNNQNAAAYPDPSLGNNFQPWG